MRNLHTYEEFLNEGKALISSDAESYLLQHIQSYHTKPGAGSYFSKSPKEIVKIVKNALLKADPDELNRIADGNGEFLIKSNNIGYNLVISYDQAKKLPDAQESTIKKMERGQEIEVPAFITSASASIFTTNEFVAIVRKNQNAPGEFFIPTVFPVGGKYKSTNEPVSKWNGKFAIVVPK